MKIIGVVFAYYPKVEQLIDNIGRYINDIDKLIIWENSVICDKDKHKILECKFSERIEFRGDGTNCGIAVPVNSVIREYGSIYDFLLTMDQDSKWINFHEYLTCVNQYLNNNTNKHIGIMGPQIVTEHINREYKGIEFVDHVITSGALYRMNIFERVGGFREDYFIDAIDEEICYRARKYDIYTIIINEAKLFQEYGETIPKKILWKKVFYMKHSPIRTYYIVRNHIYLIREYKMNLLMSMGLISEYIIKLMVKIFLFDNDRWSKLGQVIKGIKHGLNRRGTDI